MDWRPLFITKRLVQETARREYSERHASELSTALKESEQALQETRFECECYRQELDDVERQLTALLKPDSDGAPDSIKLSGLTLLYVGGRPHQIPQVKHMTERASPSFNLPWVETTLIRPNRKPAGVLVVQAWGLLPGRRRRTSGFPGDALFYKSLKSHEFEGFQGLATTCSPYPTVGPGGLRDHLTPDRGLANPANRRSDVGEISHPELVRAIDRPVAAEVDHAVRASRFSPRIPEEDQPL